MSDESYVMIQTHCIVYRATHSLTNRNAMLDYEQVLSGCKVRCAIFIVPSIKITSIEQDLPRCSVYHESDYCKSLS